jgi:hypothetical protein
LPAARRASCIAKADAGLGRVRIHDREEAPDVLVLVRKQVRDPQIVDAAGQQVALVLGRQQQGQVAVLQFDQVRDQDLVAPRPARRAAACRSCG